MEKEYSPDSLVPKHYLNGVAVYYPESVDHAHWIIWMTRLSVIGEVWMAFEKPYQTGEVCTLLRGLQWWERGPAIQGIDPESGRPIWMRLFSRGM